MAFKGDLDGATVETTRVVPVPAEGDDIVVVPAGPGDAGRPPPGRRIVVGVAIAAILALGVGLAIVARSSRSRTPAVRTSSPTTLATQPVVAKAPKVKSSLSVSHVVSPTSISAATATTPPPAAATTAAPPKQYGPSALTWTAPSSLAMTAGHTATLSVTAHNPSDGTVTLPHPLACAPRLDQGEICPQMVQLISSGQSASAQYTIDGRGFAPGHYTLKIEGVLTVAVTVS